MVKDDDPPYRKGDLSSTTYVMLSIFSMMIFGSAFWAIVISLRTIPPVTLGFFRALIAFFFMLLLYLFFLIFRKERRWFKARNFWLAGMKRKRYILLLLGSAFFGTALPNLLQNLGMLMMDEGSTSSLAALIQGAGPIFTIILAVIILGDRLGKWKMIGLLIAIPSTIVLTTWGSKGFDLGSEETLGGFLNLLTALSYSISGLFLKTSLNRGARPVSMLTMNAFFGSLLTLPFLLSFWAVGFEDPLRALDSGPVQLLSLFYLSVCVYAVAAIIWYKVVRSGELSKVTFFVFLLPVFSAVLGYVLLDERLSLVQVIASMVLIAGVLISQVSVKPKLIVPPRK